ncbi:hypothetical protein NEUTE1DRAFT_102578 [Neurospora tetrasperma FGSC 2508]|uniref:Uncharacterized protein n=1 Tax=Neurospora tetrasperma (strain FGSC 2508 / ATCC MYA-4615 / P0657) TaxID=510951 RepID=F8MSU3_NEUT8|nr:uncharacterized protein NEUTE1DRAFT_102578 [Neurospora tetrasperma FGSC 2508]EGO55126.1 hypothetical protein NEUTE1DRAFT_102578 [Neurospora tetrasperma FGSC 2508]EGZ69661.1 hypothetical protein NEUTE2DRAFT_169256 [Neurospora tetrasperma FGSC 2509]
MKPTDSSESEGANQVIHGMATLSVNPSQPSAIIMHPRPGVDVDVRSALSDPEPSTMHTQSSPPRPSTLTTMTVIPGTFSSPAVPEISTTYIHPSVRTQAAEHFPQICQHPQPFPGHYKPHRHQPRSQAARNRPCQKHTSTATAAHHMRARHQGQSLMRVGDPDHALTHPINNRKRMGFEQMRQEHRDLAAKLRALRAEFESINTLHRELTLGSSMSSLSLTAGEPKPLSVSEDRMEHLLAEMRGGNSLMKEEMSVEGGGEDNVEDVMEE